MSGRGVGDFSREGSLGWRKEGGKIAVKNWLSGRIWKNLEWVGMGWNSLKWLEMWAAKFQFYNQILK